MTATAPPNPAVSTLTPVRAGLQKTMVATANDESAHADWTYEAIRPMPVPPPPFKPGVPRRGDCSKGVQYLCRWTPGAPDPMRNNWADWGNSSTIWMENPHITLDQAEPGDMCTFGYSTGEHHALMLYAPQSDGWHAWNFGAQRQPVIDLLANEIAYHRGMTMTVCRLMKDPPVTHEDELRAMTGFYPWLAWYLGEGEHLWKPYGRANPKVRPNVPATIPAGWWAQEKTFLANRHKGNP